MKYQKILLTGGTGVLGNHILKSKIFRGKNILSPTREQMDIKSGESVNRFFSNNDFECIIHCAAMARPNVCEQKPEKAVRTNIIGTCHLVNAVFEKNRNIRFIHISTDAVYKGTEGKYSEKDATIPQNVYGWTKLGAEAAVNMLPNACIIRTRFFDPKNIKYDIYATNSFTSAILVEDFVQAIAMMIGSDFVGTINIGGKRISDYNLYREYKPTIKSCLFEEIQNKIPFKLSKDASMHVSLWKELQTRIS